MSCTDEGKETQTETSSNSDDAVQVIKKLRKQSEQIIEFTEGFLQIRYCARYIHKF